MEEILNTCFICGTEVPIECNGKCPKCGFEYSMKDECPRIVDKVCIHTNDFCTKGCNYYECEILRRFD